MTRIGEEDPTARLDKFHWTDRYRWPDKDLGWSGPCAGYPPDHKIRRGKRPQEWQGLSPKKVEELVALRKRDSIETPVTEKPATENAVEDATEKPATEIKRRGRPPKGGSLSSTERSRLHRQKTSE
jgi:hypothetical protein